jgi:hypothetical protein
LRNETSRREARSPRACFIKNSKFRTKIYFYESFDSVYKCAKYLDKSAPPEGRFIIGADKSYGYVHNKVKSGVTWEFKGKFGLANLRCLFFVKKKFVK